MPLFGTPRAFKLTQATDGSLSISEQKEGVVDSLINEVTGMIDGGLSGSVGYVHTAVEVAKAWGYPTLANKIARGEGIRLNPYSA